MHDVSSTSTSIIIIQWLALLKTLCWCIYIYNESTAWTRVYLCRNLRPPTEVKRCNYHRMQYMFLLLCSPEFNSTIFMGLDLIIYIFYPLPSCMLLSSVGADTLHIYMSLRRLIVIHCLFYLCIPEYANSRTNSWRVIHICLVNEMVPCKICSIFREGQADSSLSLACMCCGPCGALETMLCILKPCRCTCKSALHRSHHHISTV